MRRSIKQMATEFRLYWKNYVVQSLLATVSIFVVLLVLTLEEAVIVAAIGSSVFVIFAMPNSVSARPRNLLGGYAVGVLCGAVCGFLHHPAVHPAIMYSVAVGLSIFLMVVTDTEHPPASGAALGIAIRGCSIKVLIATATSAILLCLVHVCFRRRLKDLT